MFLASVNNSGYFGWIVFGCIALLGLSIIPAAIAHGKGYSWFGFYVFSLIAFPIALATALIVAPQGYYENMFDETLKIKGLLEKQQARVDEAKAKAEKERVEKEKAALEQKITENKELLNCGHEDRQRTTYLIYKGNELFARRELCKECVERIRQYGLSAFKA